MKAKLIIFSTIVLTCACGKLGPGGLKDIQTLTKTEGAIKVSSEFGYKNGSLISNKDFVNDCFILEEVTGTSSIDYYSHAYSYQGLVGGKGCYLYYYYRISYDKKTTYSFNFLPGDVCRYEEVVSIDNGKWSWECTECNYPNSSYASAVGSGDSETFPRASKVLHSQMFNVLRNPTSSKDSPQITLYAEDTYLDIYINGSSAHVIQRVPSVMDMDTFVVNNQ